MACEEGPGPTPPPGAQGRKPLLDTTQPAHPAMALLAYPDGSPKPEFEDEDIWPRGLLDLDPGSLLPVWWPTEADEGPFEPLTYEERMVTFRTNLESFLSIAVYGPDIVKSSRPFLSTTPVEQIPSAEVVLDCVRELHSLFAPNRS